MRAFSRISLAALAACVFGYGGAARGVDLLVNGTLDESVGPSGWTSSETISGTGAPISLAEHISFANSELDLGTNPLGIYVKPWSGNVGEYDMQNLKVNYTLSQTVAVTGAAGRTYTFRGDARMQPSFSGLAQFLDPLSLSDPGNTGTVMSPTNTTYNIEFLNSLDQVLGSKSTNLRTVATPDLWETHSVAEVAPTGTTKVRVSVKSLDMVDNLGSQGAFFDNYSLTDSVFVNNNRLTNPNLNTPGAPRGWALTETLEGSPIDNASFIGFAHHPTTEAPTGQGLWVRAFEGGDFVLDQTIPGVAGGDYTFTGWSYFEQNYIGGVTGQTSTETFLKLEFLDNMGAVISSQTADIADQRFAASGNTNANDLTWRQHDLQATAPAGTANIHVIVGATGLGFNVDPQQSAFFDDFALTLAGGATGDVDGVPGIDGNDVLVIQRGFGTTYAAADFTAWATNFPSAAAAVGAVPEPASAALALCGLASIYRRLSRKG